MNTLTRVVEPASEPVTLAEVKLHLRIDGTDEDALLNVLIASARRWFEDITGRTLYATTYEYSLGEWPCGDRIVLPRATTLTSIASLVYFGTDGTPATWDASNYIADTVRMPGALVLAYGNSWPSADLYPVEPIRIRYTAGMATSSPLTYVPDGIRQTLLLAIGDWYERREGSQFPTGGGLAPAHLVGLGPMVDQWRVSHEF